LAVAQVISPSRVMRFLLARRFITQVAPGSKGNPQDQPDFIRRRFKHMRERMAIDGRRAAKEWRWGAESAGR
jgi:hypothetical protein